MTQITVHNLTWLEVCFFGCKSLLDKLNRNYQNSNISAYRILKQFSFYRLSAVQQERDPRQSAQEEDISV